jgi:hypothetical protein
MHKHNEDFNSAFVLAELLTRYTGRGGLDVIDIAVECGCSKEAVYAARKGVVSLDLGMKMLRCLPDEAVEAFWAAQGFFGVRRTEAAPVSHPEFHAVVASTSASYAEFFADGSLDHREELHLHQRILPRLSAMLARVRMVRVGA